MTENHSTKGHSTKEHSQRHGGTPLVVTSAVAAFGVLALLNVDHGLWNKPKMKPMATYSTTGEAARAAGATITATEPQLAAEPLPAGPKPVNPVNPSPRFND